MKIYFCPNCHCKIIPPPVLNNPNIKADKGIVLNCGNCNKDGKNPKGKINIKTSNTDVNLSNKEENEL